MRSEPTPAEQKLWFELRATRFAATKFRRQKVIGPYIADFAARVPMLVVELDGDSHAQQATYDDLRTAYLEEQGYRVLRFTNREVMTNMEGVLLALADAIRDPLSQPSPLKERGL